MSSLETLANTRTLAQRLSEGCIPVPDALRYAALLAETLRKIHDDGRAHGTLSPGSIALTAAGLELLPPSPGPRITPYTAPELIAEGRAADARSDIFSYGALVFEMLTGRRAFAGNDEASLAASIRAAPMPASGSPAVDRLTGGCLAKDPTARWQRMQKIQLELKLLTAAARRAGAAAPVRRDPEADNNLRAEMQQLETRIAGRLQAHEQAVAEIRRSAGDAIDALRGDLSAVAAQLAATNENGSRAAQEAAGTSERLFAYVKQNMEGIAERLARLEQRPAADPQVAAQVTQALDSLRQQFGDLQVQVASDLRQFEATQQSQAGAIDSARTAMAQTDDLVERVVEALESLQSSVLEQSEERPMVLN